MAPFTYLYQGKSRYLCYFLLWDEFGTCSHGYAITIYRDYYMTIFMPYPISTQNTHISPRTDMGVSGWYGVWYENYHIVIYLSYIFLLTSLPIWYGMRSDTSVLLERRVLRMCSTAECSKCGDMVFWPGKKAVSLTWPGDMGFLHVQKAVSPTWPIITPFALHKSDLCLKAMLVSHMQNNHIF